MASTVILFCGMATFGILSILANKSQKGYCRSGRDTEKGKQNDEGIEAPSLSEKEF